MSKELSFEMSVSVNGLVEGPYGKIERKIPSMIEAGRLWIANLLWQKRLQRPGYTARMSPRLAILLVSCVATLASAQTRTQDVIYRRRAERVHDGRFQACKPNKAAVVFMVSGGWISDHTMFKSFMPDIEKVFADAGFTVFEVVTVPSPAYKVPEIVASSNGGPIRARARQRVRSRYKPRWGIWDKLRRTSLSHDRGLARFSSERWPRSHPPTDLTNWGKPGFHCSPIIPKWRCLSPRSALTPKGLGAGSKTLLKQLRRSPM